MTINFLDKFWRDKHGKVVIWQKPNMPLIGWFVFMIVAKLLPSGSVRNGTQFLSTAFIFTWAYLEITKGDSYFRRVLGAAVFLVTVLAHFRS